LCVFACSSMFIDENHWVHGLFVNFLAFSFWPCSTFRSVSQHPPMLSLAPLANSIFDVAFTVSVQFALNVVCFYAIWHTNI
jgi:ABC-type uncharacterized transport system permease subunit